MGTFAIQTFTASYDGLEDRVRLAAVNDLGEVQAIWLTRRLLDRLLPVLVETLEAQLPDTMPSDFTQSILQEQVRQARQDGEQPHPVDAGQNSESWLCSTVHVTKTEGGVVLTLTDGMQEAVIQFSSLHLRVVLDIFATVYRKAEWALSVQTSQPLSLMVARLTLSSTMMLTTLSQPPLVTPLSN